jgi:hypothetical protein
MSGENDSTLMLAPPPPLRVLATLPEKGLASLRNFVGPGDHRIEEAEQQLAEVVRSEGRSH